MSDSYSAYTFEWRDIPFERGNIIPFLHAVFDVDAGLAAHRFHKALKTDGLAEKNTPFDKCRPFTKTKLAMQHLGGHVCHVALTTESDDVATVHRLREQFETHLPSTWRCLEHVVHGGPPTTIDDMWSRHASEPLI